MAKLIGGILLLIGTSIGSGMLALPVSTAAGGFWHATVLLFFAWALTTIAAFFVVEVNLWFDEGSNMVTMARHTLGRYGEAVTWLSYGLLLYSLLCAYSAGGADLLHQLFVMVNWHTPIWINTLLFVLVLGFIVFLGVRGVDLANRVLMTVKFTAFFLVIILILPHFQPAMLDGGKVHLLASSILIVVTSFGYATIIPTLRHYFASDAKKLRFAVAVGSFGSLLIYILWDLTVQGNVAAAGAHGLIHMASSGSAASQITEALSQRVHSPLVYELVHIFTSVCMTTSFLGVALCLTDFLADSLNLGLHGSKRWRSSLLAMLPPFLIVVLDPGLFIQGLRAAGIFCVILLMLLPALMVWRGRYHQQRVADYQVLGGKALIVVEIIASLALVIYGCIYF